MSSIAIYKNRQGKTRYRVHCIENGTTRKKDSRTLEEGCMQLYLAETQRLHGSTVQEFFAMRDFTIEKVFYCYLGMKWAAVKNGELSESTYRKYVSDLNLVSDAVKNTRVGKITTAMFNAGVPNSSRLQVRAAFTMLQSVFRLPITNLCPKPVKKVKAPIIIPTREQVQVLFNSTLDPVVKMFIYLCATCGLRTSEALALRRSDIVGEGIVVQQHLTQYGLVSGLKRGDWRKIKVTDEFFALLANLDPAASYVIYQVRLISPP